MQLSNYPKKLAPDYRQVNLCKEFFFFFSSYLNLKDSRSDIGLGQVEFDVTHNQAW